MSSTTAWCLLACVLATGACGDDGGTGAEPAFPADYAATYEEVRNCRRSGDHDLNFIRVLAASDAQGPYMDRVTPFPDGAIVLKEEYDVADSACSGPIVQWTAMVKDAAATELDGWRWQRVSAARAVVESDTARCFGCHEACDGVAPHIGYDYTCTEP